MLVSEDEAFERLEAELLLLRVFKHFDPHANRITCSNVELAAGLHVDRGELEFVY
jgi:hypothetical protein